MIIIGRCFGCIQHNFIAIAFTWCSGVVPFIFITMWYFDGTIQQSKAKQNKQITTEEIHWNTKYVFILMLLSFSPFIPRCSWCFGSCNELVNGMQDELNKTDGTRQREKNRSWNVPSSRMFILYWKHTLWFIKWPSSATHTHFDVTINRPEAIKSDGKKSFNSMISRSRVRRW